MGGSPTDSRAVSSYYSSNSHITTASRVEEVFSSRSLKNELNPAMLKNGIRESCDSIDSPNSYAIAFGFDLTGSMGHVPFEFLKNGFPRFIKMIQGGVLGYDPHILFCGIGDVKCDDAPLQVTQFEADTRMLDQLQRIYVEGGGGGNDGESYNLPWYFLAKHTKIDCWKKRRKKGTFISVGDDKPHPSVSRSQIKRVFGEKEGIEVSSLSSEELRDMASEMYNIYHIILSGHGYGSYNVESCWKKLLGSHVCKLEDEQFIPELVTTILKIQEGMDKYDAIQMIETHAAASAVKEALEAFAPYDCSISSTKDGVEII